jgi:FkbM family methyltransferase
MRSDYLAINARHWLLRQEAARFALHYPRVNRLFLKWPIDIRLDVGGRGLVASEAALQVHFCHVARARRYSNGIRLMLDRLLDAYMLDRVALRPGDWVLDCGANVGEVSLALLQKEPCLNIIAVEPEQDEADCADRNIYQGQPHTLRCVLWHEETTLRFYSASATADSSAIEPPSFTSVREVPATTIDALLDRRGCQRLRLLKLEAEGAEPEILRGAAGSLSRIDFIAADLGPERGVSQEETATPVINHLLSSGFEIAGVRFDRGSVLFKNRLAGR